MKVKQLKRLLEDYNDDAEVIGVNWTNGETFAITVGGDDEDEYDKFCRISIE